MKRLTTKKYSLLLALNCLLKKALANATKAEQEELYELNNRLLNFINE